MTTASITFTYSLENDKDLAEWLSSITSDRSRAIREMLMRGLKQCGGDATLDMILEEIRAIRGGNGNAPPAAPTTEATVPAKTPASVSPDTLENLRNLGK